MAGLLATLGSALLPSVIGTIGDLGKKVISSIGNRIAPSTPDDGGLRQ